MSKRIGKYKVSTKESALSLADGGTVEKGSITIDAGTVKLTRLSAENPRTKDLGAAVAGEINTTGYRGILHLKMGSAIAAGRTEQADQIRFHNSNLEKGDLLLVQNQHSGGVADVLARGTGSSFVVQHVQAGTASIAVQNATAQPNDMIISASWAIIK